jgi:putative ABC transport system permease protein
VTIVGIVSPSGALALNGSFMLLAVNDYKAASPPTVTPSRGSSPSQLDQDTSPQRDWASLSGRGTNPVNTTDQNHLVYNTIDITANDHQIDDAANKIEQQFPIADTQTVVDALKQQQSSIDNVQEFLAIAGLLALLIGGIGVVNTMQALLSRRKTEIAMFKTTGYRRIDLYLLFGLEAGLLGLIGGVVGAGAAIGVSYLLINVVEQKFNFNIPFVLDWFTIGSGVIIGLVTALIFGLLPIVQAANTRPLNVIRELSEGRGAKSLLLTIFLLIVLSVLFCILAMVLLSNNVLLVVYSVYGTFIFLGLLSLFFGLVILFISKLPVPEHFSLSHLALVLLLVALSALLFIEWPGFGGLLLVVAFLGFVIVLLPRTWKADVKMALRNLGRQRARTTTTMLALFVAIFTIGLILVLGQDVHDQINSVIEQSLNYNIYVVTAHNDTQTLRNKLKTLPGLTVHQEHSIVSTSPVSINDTPISKLLPIGVTSGPAPGTLGRSAALHFLSGIEGYDVANGQIPATDATGIVQGRNLRPGDAGTNNVVISSLLATLDPLHLKLGDRIVLTNTSHSVTRTVNVIGIYQSTGFSITAEPIWGTKDTADAFSPADLKQAVFYLKIDSSQLGKATDAIGQAVPDAVVLNLGDLADFINRLLNDVLLTLITIASLSLLAGVIVIANAVGLAMLERRRELGVLKSVGYTSRSILREVLVENGVVGGTGALLAMLLVILTTSLLGTFVFNANFGVSTMIALGLVVGSAGLAMLVSALVAWGAVCVRPLEVLRYE